MENKINTLGCICLIYVDFSVLKTFECEKTCIRLRRAKNQNLIDGRIAGSRPLEVEVAQCKGFEAGGYSSR